MMQNAEKWRPVPVEPYNRAYLISSLGRCRSVKRETKRGKRGGGLLRPAPNSNGYPSVSLSVMSQQRTFKIHQLVLKAFVGEPPPGEEARHLDGNRGRSVISNLAWGTRKENAADRTAHGRVRCGERQPNAKLTDAIVVDMRRRHAAGETVTALANEYKVEYSTARKAISGSRWRHVVDLAG